MVSAERVELHLMGIEKLLPPPHSSTGLSLLHTFCIFKGGRFPTHILVVCQKILMGKVANFYAVLSLTCAVYHKTIFAANLCTFSRPREWDG